MRILAVDQARDGGWAVFDYENKVPIAYGTFNYPSSKYEFGKFLAEAKALIWSIIEAYETDAVFIEDIQLRKNVDSFKKLAMLQGALVSMFAEREFLYDIIAPSSWQNFCQARGRTAAEVKGNISAAPQNGKKQSKLLSIQFAETQFGISTDDDNLADSLCLGFYAANNIKIIKKGKII